MVSSPIILYKIVPFCNYLQISEVYNVMKIAKLGKSAWFGSVDEILFLRSK
jgi:hypothetical protein